MSLERLLSADEVQEILGVSQSEAYRLMNHLEHFKHRGKLRVSESVLMRFIKDHTVSQVNFDLILHRGRRRMS